ncbi:peptidyl-prolyl cis-trans isomerase C [Paracoccus isoporae]|uniref:Parvulin-like PPIase n=1 Tax=Paracoccus isoporae TaxID=591205 RepID=A0A1G7CM49_9RHOB|nr:peptidylprolyl isomerase [Paracoccus isoporae]SDE39525.1 peptidyl-prolyl cis-trans isomerase C [Paracoccus isoporae]
MFRPTLSALALVTAFGTAAAAQDASTVVATVNGTDITLGQMAAMKQALPPEMAQLPAEESWELLLDEMIRQAAIADTVAQNLSPRDEAVLANQRRDYLVRSAMESIADFEPSEDEIQAAYDAAFPAEEPQKEYDADHILLETEEAANAVIEELAGGADFATLAEKRSIDTASGTNGGDLGWFTLDRMVPEFSDAVAAMEEGATSDAPVQSQFGYHVIKLNGTRDVEAPALDEIREPLIQQIRRERVAAEIERIASEADVQRTEDLDPSLLEQDILGME